MLVRGSSGDEDSSTESSGNSYCKLSPAKSYRDIMVQDSEKGKKERGRRRNRRHKSKLEDPNRTRAQRNFYLGLQTRDDKDPARKRKRSHTCSYCKKPGHNIKRCSKLSAQKARENATKYTDRTKKVVDSEVVVKTVAEKKLA